MKDIRIYLSFKAYHKMHFEPLPIQAQKSCYSFGRVSFGRDNFLANTWTNSMCIAFNSEKAMAPHSSTLAWKIPWMEEPGRLQSIGLRRVGHDWATSLSLFTFLHWRRKWQPTPVFLPGESQGWESLVAAVYGVTQSWTRLKWLSSSSI